MSTKEYYSCNLNGLFSGKLFVIPKIQRYYAWEKQQLQEMWWDINSIPEKQPHPMQQIILKEKQTDLLISSSLNTLKTYDVVDGQQRLTTIVILLKVITMFDEMRPYRSIINHQFFLTGIHNSSNSVCRLTLLPDLHTTFLDMLTNENNVYEKRKVQTVIRSQRYLRATFDFFKAKLIAVKQNNVQNFVPTLINLYQIVTERLHFQCCILDEEVSIGRMFEIMNSRGVALLNLEKLKNKFMDLSDRMGDKQLTQKIEKVWETIYKETARTELDSDGSLDQYLHATWQSIHSQLVCNKANLYTEISQYFTRTVEQSRLSENISHFLDVMLCNLHLYCNIYHPFREDSYEGYYKQYELIVYSIKLHRIGKSSISRFLPLIMAINYKYRDQNSLLSLIKWCEVFMMRLFVFSKKKSDTGRNEMIKLAGKVYTGEKTISDVQIIMGEYIKKHGKNASITNYITSKTTDFYDEKVRDTTKYILIEYDYYLQQEQSVQDLMVIEWADVEIEHILPQVYDNCLYWTKVFGSASECKKHVNRLGNMTLSTKEANASYGSKSFPEKKLSNPGYSTSTMLIETRLCMYDDWGSDEIENRQQEMAEFAKIRWNW